jgi:hypothetical protein
LSRRKANTTDVVARHDHLQQLKEKKMSSFEYKPVLSLICLGAALYFNGLALYARKTSLVDDYTAAARCDNKISVDIPCSLAEQKSSRMVADNEGRAHAGMTLFVTGLVVLPPFRRRKEPS